MNETPVKHPLRVFGCAIAAVALFTVMNVFVRLSSEAGIPVDEIMFFRSFVAVIPLLLIIRNHPQGFDLLKTGRPWGHALRGCIGISSMALCFLSVILLPIADATAIQFAAPLILTVLSVPFLGEKVGPWRWSAVLVGLIGVLVIVDPTGDTNMLGTSVALLSAVGIAAAMICIRRMGETEHALTIVFYFFVSGTVLSGLALPFFWVTPTWLNLLYLCLTGITGMVAQIFMTKAYANAPAAYVSPFNYLAIIFATAVEWAIWSTMPGWHVLGGAVIVIASGLFILYRETTKKHSLENPVTQSDIYAATPVEPTDADLADQAGQTAAA